MSNTPKLRFKEFGDEWNIKKLGDLGEFKKTYSFSRSVEGDGKYKHIHYGDIHMNYNGIITKEKLVPTIDIPDKEDYVFIEERDIIFADASEDKKDLGKVAVVKTVDDNTISGLHTICFKPSMELNSEFFLNHSLNKEYLKFMYTKGVGAKVLGISKSSLMNYEFLAPSLSEQEKIASFLSLYDKKIELQEEKVESLKKYKKGMMQKIFSQELRFKDEDGEDYPEWEEKKIGEVLKERKSFAEKTSNIKHATLSKDGLFEKTERYDRDFLVKDNNKKYKITLINDICYNPANLKFGVICRNKLGKAIFSPIYITFETNSNTDFRYIEYFVTRHEFISKARRYEEGTVYERKAVKPEDLILLKIKLPSLPEQQKIADFLSTIDSKIELEQKKLEELKEYKKGLLQQMFV